MMVNATSGPDHPLSCKRRKETWACDQPLALSYLCREGSWEDILMHLWPKRGAHGHSETHALQQSGSCPLFQAWGFVIQNLYMRSFSFDELEQTGL